MLQLMLRVHRWLKYVSGDITLFQPNGKGVKCPHICGCRYSVHAKRDGSFMRQQAI